MEGKSAGERGKIIAVDRKKNTVVVDQLNLVRLMQRGFVLFKLIN